MCHTRGPFIPRLFGDKKRREHYLSVLMFTVDVFQGHRGYDVLCSEMEKCSPGMIQAAVILWPLLFYVPYDKLITGECLASRLPLVTILIRGAFRTHGLEPRYLDDTFVPRKYTEFTNDVYCAHGDTVVNVVCLRLFRGDKVLYFFSTSSFCNTGVTLTQGIYSVHFRARRF